MKLSKFKAFVETFGKRPVPGRHLFVWNGTIDTIMGCIPREMILTMDMVNFVDNITSEQSDEKILSDLKKSIANELIRLSNETKKQAILIVRNNYLFPKYNIPLSLFHNHFINDRLSVLFQIDNYYIDQKLPDCAVFRPEKTLGYFEHLTEEDNIILED